MGEVPVIATPDGVVSELFQAARTASEQRFLLCLLDVGRLSGHLTIGSERDLAIHELATFLAHLDGIPLRDDDEYRPTFRKLQILAYSQFWDSRAIQRMLTSLVRTASGKTYDPTLYEPVPKGMGTYQIMRTLQMEAKAANLTLGRFLEATYHNQIRNAFVHSQLYFGGDLMCFMNYEPRNRCSKPSLKLAEWDRIWAATRSFISSFFTLRLDVLREFRQSLPIRVNLPELEPFLITFDERGCWIFAG